MRAEHAPHHILPPRQVRHGRRQQLHRLHRAVRLCPLSSLSKQSGVLTTILRSPLLHRLTAILVSRFLIDLQVANQRSLGHDDSSAESGLNSGASGQTDSIVFNRVIGSLISSIGPVGIRSEFEEAEAHEPADISSSNLDVERAGSGGADLPGLVAQP